MKDTPPASPAALRKAPVGWLLTTLLVCAHFALTYVTNHKQFLDLAAYAHGTERTPFQYRVLMAWVMRLGDLPLVGRVAGVFPEPLKDPYRFVLMAVAFVCMVGAVFATRRTLERLGVGREFGAWAALLVPLMAYFQFALPYGLVFILPYDIPSLLCFCLAFLALASEDDLAFYAVFAVGTLVRETMLFAIVPFAIWRTVSPDGSRREGGWARAASHVAALVVVWVAIKLLVVRLYADRTPNPRDAGLFETHVAQNLHSILKPYQWPLLLSGFAFALPLLIAQRRMIGDARLRLSLEVLLPAWAALMMIVGVFVEVRIFGELIAPVALGVAMIAWRHVRPPTTV